jgi:hypothetical protein
VAGLGAYFCGLRPAGAVGVSLLTLAGATALPVLARWRVQTNPRLASDTNLDETIGSVRSLGLAMLLCAGVVVVMAKLLVGLASLLD